MKKPSQSVRTSKPSTSIGNVDLTNASDRELLKMVVFYSGTDNDLLKRVQQELERRETEVA